MVGEPGLAIATVIDIELSHVAGRVESINGVTLLILGRDGVRRTVVAGSSTAFLTNGVFATLADVAVGSYVIAEGTYNTSVLTLDARVVDLGQSRSAANSLLEKASQQRSIHMRTNRAVGQGGSPDSGQRQ